MIKVRLLGHDFRYELFQILSLFYDKAEILFEYKGDDYDFESIVDYDNHHIEFKIYNSSNLLASENISINIDDKKTVKNAIKLTALRALKKYTKTNIPWGILVGIRPTKIAHECFKKGLNEEDTVKNLMLNYDLSHDKALLTVEVAKNEARFLTCNKKEISVYIDVPFCPTRCVYCSFTSNSVGGNSRLIEGYIDALIKELQFTFDYIKKRNFKIDTMYIGGGTPTALTANQLERIFEILGSCINLKDLREFTVEAGRPDSIDMQKLMILKKYGCSRISINPQTMNDETLKRIGRMHTSKEVVEKFHLARDLGFDNINMDVIVGLPGEGEREIINTMETLKALSPENITIHTMAIKRASFLNEIGYREESAAVESMCNIASTTARSMGMYPYYMYRQKNMVSPLENVGYCKKDRECIYNIQMIAENISIAAMGPGAITKLVFHDGNRIERVANVKDTKEYIERIDEMIEKKIEGLSMI